MAITGRPFLLFLIDTCVCCGGKNLHRAFYGCVHTRKKKLVLCFFCFLKQHTHAQHLASDQTKDSRSPVRSALDEATSELALRARVATWSQSLTSRGPTTKKKQRERERDKKEQKGGGGVTPAPIWVFFFFFALLSRLVCPVFVPCPDLNSKRSELTVKNKKKTAIGF